MTNRDQAERPSEGEQGYLLLSLIVAIALILLALSVAATEVAFSLRREREVESARRADQYVRAIRRFYLKNQHYPGSIEQLSKTNNIRYLRQLYIDPLTGKADYRLILVGQNKTTVKGFFGEPLQGLPTAGLGSAAGNQSAGLGGAAGTVSGAAGATGTTGAGTNGTGTSGTGANGASGAAGSTLGGTSSTTGGFGSTSGFGGSSGLGNSTGAGPIMGVGSSATGHSLFQPNGQTTYESWEFLYDPRLELLKAKAAMNSGLGSAGAGSLGQTPGAFGSTTPTSPTGTTPPANTNGQGTNGTTPQTQP